VHVSLRNDSTQTWKAGDVLLAWEPADRQAAGNNTTALSDFTKSIADVYPGAVVTFDMSIKIPSDMSTVKSSCIVWLLRTPSGSKSFYERFSLVANDPGALFVVNDVNRHMKTGQKLDARAAVVNNSPHAIKPGDFKVGARWFYLDGTLAGDASASPVALSRQIQTGDSTSVTLSLRAPEYPGRYILVWDTLLPDGRWGTDAAEHLPLGSYAAFNVWVEPDKHAQALPLDLTALMGQRDILFEGEGVVSGGAMPAEVMPPDASREVGADLLALGKPGPGYYPSGYYGSSVGDGMKSNHRISFLLPSKQGFNTINADGQTINLPKGDWRYAHILAATTQETSETAEYGVVFASNSVAEKLSVGPCLLAKTTDHSTAAFISPYHIKAGQADASAGSALWDVVLPIDATKESGDVKSIKLPKSATLKIFAITLEK